MTKEVEITSLTYGGRGLGRIEGKVVFVPFAVPGDVLKVEITKEKKSFAEGEIIDILKPSEDRVEPRCGVFGVCGGCAWQNITYTKQLEWKERIFRETLERIGGVEFDKPVDIVHSGEPYNYRSRARFQIDGANWGFFAASSHRVVDIESCPLLEPKLNETFAALKGLLKARKHAVVSLEIAFSERDSKTVASFYSVAPLAFETDEIFASSDLLKGFELFRSKRNGGKGGKGGKGARGGRGVRRSNNQGAFRRVSSYGGMDILLKVRGMELKAPGGSFTQVNPVLNDILVEKVLEIADIKDTDCVLDLFCGVGNLTIPLKGLAARALGVERDKRAIEYGRANAGNNGGIEIKFECEDVTKWLKDKGIKNLARPFWDVVVLDPPRGGDLDTVKSLINLAPRKIVYVSCSPPTLARDISFLRENGYEISGSVVLDMFPQTFHIESVVGLVRV